jgi:4-amino-4-deoxychorismate lyase
VSMWINGVEARQISADDRGLCYGDGLFETMRLRNGVIAHLARHLARLRAGCERLALHRVDLAQIAGEITAVAGTQADGVLKLIVTRGSGSRGYRPSGAENPTRIVTWHPARASDAATAVAGVRARHCTTPVNENAALAGLKHLNRLDSVLARSEWTDPEIAEGLMSDSRGCIIGGTMSNVFAVRNQTLLTPLLDRCGVSGIMRGLVIESARAAGIATEERNLTRADLATADELFLTNAVLGIWPVRALESRDYPMGPTTRTLQRLLGVPV